MAFREVKVSYWVPEKVGEQLTGLVGDSGTVETQYGTATYYVVHEWDVKKNIATGREENVIVSGGLQQLPSQQGKLVRITYNGEKENPRPKRGYNKMYKDYTLEVDDDYFKA